MKLLACFLLLPILSLAQSQRGVMLGDLTWQQAEKILTPETIIVIPLGAEAKEHGPHLLLKNDLILAEYFQQRVLEEANVVIAPIINYHFYPSFLEYPGSTSLRLSTARDLVVDICRSLAHYGPKKFYILNTGISTVRALNPARDTLAAEGIIMQFTDLNSISELEKKISKQEGGSHADEIETSMILYMKPEAVNMKLAVKDYNPSTGRGLTRDPNNKNSTYSPSGTWGDATLATVEKGKLVTEALVVQILKEIEELRKK
ncbi:MAG: creatininase family protein [Cyclobacteriaceae bacterium]|jgi:creatinine amidohydrolase|nr:creatininase family protein [Cyclobacteriaceae bacterium]